MKRFLLLFTITLVASAASYAQRYVGGDISQYPLMQAAGAKYFDHDGQAIAEPISYYKQIGMNAMRVRLFVDPSKYTGNDKDANACQDLAYVKKLAKSIKDAGHKLMLDFHYSDTWADPAKQWTPADWTSLTDEELYQKIYDYTKDVLQQMVAAGATPELIQTGNEISYGMLWGAYTTNSNSSALKKCYSTSDANWDRFTTLLKQAGKACREVCPQAKIILHTERVPNASVLKDFYTRMRNANVDYDIIGLSYYPCWHGPLSTLETAINSMETNFADKDIMVVEVGYSLKWALGGTTYDYTDTYPYTDEGQCNFTQDLITMLNKHSKVTGLFWWNMDYNGYGANLSGWWNAPLFDSETGRATSALYVMKNFMGNTSGIESVNSTPDTHPDASWYTLDGKRTERPSQQGVYVHQGKKIIIK